MDQWELFDLENDPNEMNNLYANAAYKEIVQSLQYKINQLQKKYKDDMSLDEMRAMTINCPLKSPLEIIP